MQRCRLLDLDRVQGADAFEDLAHHGRLGRVGKALTDMPLGQSSEALFERVEAKAVGVVNQVADDAVAGGWQKTAPAHLEVFNGGLVTAPGVFPRTSP
ncbi:hypothetical protein D9M68_1005510 [compost metagenome]